MNPSGALTFRFFCNKNIFGHNNSKGLHFGKAGTEKVFQGIYICLCMKLEDKLYIYSIKNQYL